MLSDVYFQLGWSRQLPPAALAIVSPLVTEGPLTSEELEEHLYPQAGAEQGWESPAWEPLHEWTDEELHTLRADFADTPFAAEDDEPDDAAGVMAEEARDRARRITEMASYSQALGVAEVQTVKDLLEFMVACGVVERRRAGNRTVLELNALAPLPAEVLPLPADEKREEDERRWQATHESTAQAIIRLFDPDQQQRDTLSTTLDQLATELSVDMESARAGVLNLLTLGDFTATIDIPRAEHHQAFDLIVDWDLFNQTRIGIRHGRPSDDAGDGENL